jgi:hypothetical protein
MSWLGRLFGTKKAIDDFTDKENGHLAKLGGWIGNLSHTDEEKAEDNQVTRKWAVDFLTAMAPFKVMHRIMVTIIMSVWALYCVNMLVAIWIYSNDVIADILLFIQTPFVWVPVSGAVSLYLLGGVVPSRSK